MVAFFQEALASLPSLKSQKSPPASAIIGLLFGGIGLGIYFESIIDLVILMFMLVLLTIIFPGIGFLGGMLFAAIYGYYRAMASNRRTMAPPPISPPGAGFTFYPPVGWSVENVSSSPIPMCFGPAVANFRPNINIAIYSLPETLQQALDRVRWESQTNIQNWTDLSCDWFTTHHGKQGVKWTAQGAIQPNHLFWIIYAFERSDSSKVFVFCCVPFAYAQNYVGVLDHCATAMLIA